METNNKNVRSRNWNIISYVPVPLLEEYVKNDFIDRFAMICHDKDVNEDGEVKECHTHIVVTYRNARTFTSVLKDFERYKRDTEQNTRILPVKDLNKELRYLIHIDDTDKYQYPITDVSTNRDNLLNLFEEDEQNLKVEQLLDDINNDVPLRTMVRRYGRDFILNYSKYTEFAQRMYYEEKNLEPLPNVDVPVEMSTALLNKKLSKGE